MLSLIEQIKTGALWTFPGGVHPVENKSQSVSHALSRAAIADEIVLPVKQHIGKPGTITVEVGEQVLKGQSLTKYDTSFMLPVHAPTSGTVIAIEPRTTAHPSGLSETCIVIKPDMADSWIERDGWSNYAERTPDELIEKIRQAGVSGMGGAGFPTAKKIQSGLARTEILIINAAECEPYITADDMLMREHAEEIIQGIEIVEHILKPKLTVIGIEDNKPEAVKALQQAAEHKDIVIRVIPTKYPSGGEKQLIKILTNKEVPNGGIPADIGILVQNVGSLHAIKRAVCDGEPLVERIVTLTGDTFKQPRNVWALLGTPVQALLDEFSYKADKKLPRLIMGGPMMGFTLPHAQVPITKTSNCILAPTRKEISPNQYEMACIRCGQCAEACPASLLPQQLVWHAKAEELDKCEELNIKDCIECGACAFVCPSEIPLVQYYRQAKAEIRTRKEEAEAAERAKIRFEEKKARLERDKAARENRFKKAADDRRKEMKSSGGDDAIAAAIARVKAQKAQPATEEKAVKPAVAAAIAKAKAKQAEAMQSGQAEPDNSEMAKLREERKRQARERKAEKAQQSERKSTDDKKDAVAAAIARAKAKKAQQAGSDGAQAPATDKKAAVAAAIARAKAKKAQTEETDQAPPAEDKKAAVAAAIARAKARKAEQQTQSEPVEPAPAAEATGEDPKKAAVAAAVARAKARKAEQQTQSEPVEQAPASEATEEDPKKAAVAAAIARAKARKAKQKEQSEPVEQAPAAEVAEEDPKKAAVAAAIARAKTRKAEQQAQSEPVEQAPTAEVAEEDPKKAAVAAAIARAKARKAEQQAQSEPVEQAPTTEATEEDPKKAAVAAAVARAKARKAKQQEQSEPVEQAPTAEVAEEDPKKAAVAAAIARAKARKAEKEQQKQFEEKE